MRELNAHCDYKSDWEPNTKLLYIVRKYYGIYICQFLHLREKNYHLMVKHIYITIINNGRYLFLITSNRINFIEIINLFLNDIN